MKKFVVKLITHDGNYDNKKDQIDCSVVGVKDNFEAAKDFMKNKQEKIIEEYVEDRDECELEIINDKCIKSWDICCRICYVLIITEIMVEIEED